MTERIVVAQAKRWQTRSGIACVKVRHQGTMKGTLVPLVERDYRPGDIIEFERDADGYVCRWRLNGSAWMTEESREHQRPVAE